MKQIRPPFFEIGPKAYLYGDDLLKLAKAADEASKQFDVHVIFTAPLAEIRLICENTSSLFVFAQHMDPLEPGRGMGSVLAESVKAAGAAGVMLNHAERAMTLTELRLAIKRARETGLMSIVCADSIADARAVACFKPDIIVAEPSELIGTGIRSDEEYIRATTEAIRAVDPEIQILQAAGIKDENDVYSVIRAGADATGSTSGIIKAANPCEMTFQMLAAVRRAWDEARG